MRISKLMAISEAATGYAGGTPVDELPHLSLYEAAGMLPTVIMESQMRLNDQQIADIDAMSEAAITYASVSNMDAIVEASFKNMWENVKAFFDRIRNWLKSIIAKISMQIDKVTKSGSDLYRKYGTNSDYTNKDCSGLKVTGYTFPGGDDPLPNVSKQAESIADVVDSVLKDIDAPTPEEFTSKMKSSGGIDKASDVSGESVDKLKDLDNSERQYAFLEKFVGSDISMSKDTWSTDIKSAIYGDKEELSYGSDFTQSSVAEMLQGAKQMNAVKNSYSKVLNAANRYESRMKQQMKALETESSRMKDDNKKLEGDESKAAAKNVTALSAATAYYTEYLKFIHTGFAAINTLLDVELKYHKARNDQAKTLFAKMFSFKAKKSGETESAIDNAMMGELEAFDFAL